MAEIDVERSHLIAALVGRLRMIQTDLADRDSAAREEHLNDVVQQALNELAVSDRQSFLEELAQHFPTWKGGTGTPLPAKALGSQALSSFAEWNDPLALVVRLTELTAAQPATEKRTLLEMLREALHVPAPTAGAWPEEVLASLRRVLQIPDQRKFDAGHAMELMVLLTDFTARLHQSVWNTWETGIAPNSEIRKRSVLRTALGRFLAADAQVPRTMIADDLDKLQQIVAALTAAVKEAGKQFALRVMKDKFDPAQIHDNVIIQHAKRKMFGPTIEEQCWEKYKDLYQAMGERMVEDEIMRVVAEFTEKMLKGLRGLRS